LGAKFLGFRDTQIVAAEEGKVDPMKQFQIEPLFGSENWKDIAGIDIAFTNSALWMMITTIVLWAFVAGGMKRELVPGRWQMAVETFTGFIDDMLDILFANLLGLLPIGVLGLHPFTFTSHFTVTGVLAVISFSIVLAVGFWKHGFKFFSLFVPHGTPIWLMWLIPVIELISFMVRPFSLALRLFVAMMAGHVLLKVLSSFVIDSINGGAVFGAFIGVPSMILMIAISALEILVAGIQAYVFALLTSLYINDAEHLH